MSRTQLPFWLFTIGLIAALCLPVLVQKGMFMDGLLYTCVARNEAMGYGTFWFPQWSKLNIAGIPSFHEQPPLVFGIQAVFFRILGDHLYVERLYTFLMLCLNAWLIVRIWQRLPLTAALRKVAWLPLICWIGVPVCFWSFGNNMHENTLSLFALAAVLTGYRAHQEEKRRYLHLLLSGLFVFLATFSKGIPGFFPLTLPFIWWLVFDRRKWGKAFLYFSLIAAVPAVIYAILFSLPVSGESLRIYLFQRALNRIDNMPTTTYHLEIVWRTFTELLPPLLLVSGIYVAGRRSGMRLSHTVQSHVLFFLLLGMAGSVPLAFTLVQKGFYLVPAFPYYGLALALVAAPAVSHWMEQLNRHAKRLSVLRTCSVIALVGVLSVTAWCWGRYYRDQSMIEDVVRIGKVVPAGATLSLPFVEFNEYDFMLPGYLMRYNRQSLDPYHPHEYFIALKENAGKKPKGYQPVPVALNDYVLFRKATAQQGL